MVLHIPGTRVLCPHTPGWAREIKIRHSPFAPYRDEYCTTKIKRKKKDEPPRKFANHSFVKCLLFYDSFWPRYFPSNITAATGRPPWLVAVSPASDSFLFSQTAVHFFICALTVEGTRNWKCTFFCTCPFGECLSAVEHPTDSASICMRCVLWRGV